MEVESKEVGRVLLVRPLTKRMDARTCSEFKVNLNELIADGNLFLALNLSLLDFMDSSGLGTLVNYYKELKSKHGSMVMYGVGINVMNLFKLTAMDKVFEIFPDEQAAVQALEEKSSSNQV